MPKIWDDYRARRQDFAKFKSLIATPGNLNTAIFLPANGTFSLSITSVLASATILIDVVGPSNRAIGNPAGAANAGNRIGQLEHSSSVKKRLGVSGTVSLYVHNGFGRRFLIAQG